MELFAFVFAALFSVINPLGAVPIFVGLTSDDSAAERRRIALWTAIDVFLILVISFFAGRFVLEFFGISIDSLRIAGGLIIVNSGFNLLSGNMSKRRGMNKKVTSDAQQRNDISLTPLAIPMLAGPGSISLLIALDQDYTHINEKIITVLSIFTVCLTIFLVLRSAPLLARALGASGIVAISRIIGFIVIAIGVQYISSAVINILNIKA